MLVRAHVAAAVVLVGAALVTLALIRARHGGGPAHAGRLIRTVLGITLFSILVNDRASVERGRQMLKSAYAIIIGALLIVVWIYRLEIYRYIPRFDLFG
jgi:hypothetical protein